MNDDITIRAATASDGEAIIELLEQYGLCTHDIAPGFFGFLVAERAGQVIGTIGLEDHGGVGLLRSLAVAEEHQGRGVGGELFQALLQQATVFGIASLFLLTASAEAYFREKGFTGVPRSDVPAGIRQTEQFTSICPETATVMAMHLQRSSPRGG